MAEKKWKRVGVIGMGPVGMILASHMQEAGLEVGVCDLDKVKMNSIREGGVELSGVIEKKCRFKNVFTNATELAAFRPELIFLCLKTTQLPGAMLELEALETGNAGFVCAMNGIDVEQMISSVVGEARTFRMVINFAGNLLDPGKTNVTFFNPPNFIASMDDSRKDEADSLAVLLSKVKLDTESVSSFRILHCAWEKTILNASLSALCAVGRLTIREAMSNPDTVELVEQIIEEAIEVAEAEKIKFEDEFIRKCLRYLQKAGNHFPSLAVDLLNNRPTEIDYLNGKIVEYGRKHYIRTSLNLTFTNMVKAISGKSIKSSVQNTRNAILSNGKVSAQGNGQTSPAGNCYLGVDLGSAYTKFTILDETEKVVFRMAVKTLNREKISVKHVIETLKNEYPIRLTCATGYGRKHLPAAELVKTELNCAALGASFTRPGKKTIIDIGGEDIKIIRCKDDGSIDHFILNDKCAAGTGSFITEIADRADIRIHDMSDLASKSSFSRELNSFCTVFAKTEVMGWLFEGMPVEDISRGIYVSILNRVLKMRIDPGLPLLLIGGVVAYHPVLAAMLKERLRSEVIQADNPQYVVSLGAALYAKRSEEKIQKEENGMSLQK